MTDKNATTIKHEHDLGERRLKEACMRVLDVLLNRYIEPRSIPDPGSSDLEAVWIAFADGLGGLDTPQAGLMRLIKENPEIITAALPDDVALVPRHWLNEMAIQNNHVDSEFVKQMAAEALIRQAMSVKT